MDAAGKHQHQLADARFDKGCARRQFVRIQEVVVARVELRGLCLVGDQVSDLQLAAAAGRAQVNVDRHLGKQAPCQSVIRFAGQDVLVRRQTVAILEEPGRAHEHLPARESGEPGATSGATVAGFGARCTTRAPSPRARGR